MKKWGMIVLVGCLFIVPSLVQAQADKILERFFGREESRIRPEDLRVLQLEITPDPVREGQRVVFRVTISNGSRHSGRVTLAIKDKDEIINNWYLDAWCHTRNDIRVFSVDSIATARVLDERARDVADAELDAVLAAGYGIFAGPARQVAVLQFSPGRARWVADETWHSRQVGRWQADGSYRLEVPYSQEPELVMDILKYGRDVEVLGPSSLRDRVAGKLRAAVAHYGP